jgi:hypothetical protein
MAHIFISYAREDQLFAKGMHDALESEGLEVWWDPELYAGQRFRDEIETQIRRSNAAVCIWSPASVVSDWVLWEARLALCYSRLLPISLDEVDLPQEFSGLHTISHRDWASTVKELTRALKINAFYYPRSVAMNYVTCNPLADRETILALFVKAMKRGGRNLSPC